MWVISPLVQVELYQAHPSFFLFFFLVVPLGHPPCPSCTLLILRVLISHEHQLKGEYSQKLTMKHVIVQKAEKLVDQIQELCDTWGEFSQTLTGG